MYSIYLLQENGQGLYLSVKDRVEWKTRRTALRHAKDAAYLAFKGHFKGNSPVVAVDLENEFGECVETVWTIAQGNPLAAVPVSKN